MSTESLIWIYHCQTCVLPTKLSSSLMQIPFSFRNQKVIVHNLTIEVGRWNVEVGRSSIEIQMHSVSFSRSCFP